MILNPMSKAPYTRRNTVTLQPHPLRMEHHLFLTVDKFARAASAQALTHVLLRPCLRPRGWCQIARCWLACMPPLMATRCHLAHGLCPTSPRHPFAPRSRHARLSSKGEFACPTPTRKPIRHLSEWRQWPAGRSLEHLRLDKAQAFRKGFRLKDVLDTGYPKSGVVLLQHVCACKRFGEFRVRCVGSRRHTTSGNCWTGFCPHGFDVICSAILCHRH